MSELHHSHLSYIVFDFYTLIHGQRNAREGIISCVTEAAVEAFGPGATVEAFGSYGDSKHEGLCTASSGEDFVCSVVSSLSKRF